MAGSIATAKSVLDVLVERGRNTRASDPDPVTGGFASGLEGERGRREGQGLAPAAEGHAIRALRSRPTPFHRLGNGLRGRRTVSPPDGLGLAYDSVAMFGSDGPPREHSPVSERLLETTHCRTLPPPEWRAARARGASSRPPTVALPLPRRIGTRAEEAWLRARVEEAHAAGDTSTLRTACTTLARWLASRDRDLDEAVDLASMALSLGADLELRREASAWLESLGEPARAAGVLKPNGSIADESPEFADILVRAGLLRTRAGAAASAALAFQSAMALDSEDPLPAEWLGALSAWDPESAPPWVGSEAYVEAARRHHVLQQTDAELEDLWRAFATDPTSAVAVQALGGALEQGGRVAASDEVWRAHAKALSGSALAGSTEIHERRTAAALAAGMRARALGAALDRSAGADLAGDEGQALETVLREVGLPNAHSMRRELTCDLRSSALALESIAARSPTSWRAMLLAVASERHRQWGDRMAARSAAAAATEADPDDARCAAALADAVIGDFDRQAAFAIERAILLVGPRPDWCSALANILSAIGRREQAIAWDQRYVSLRPGDWDAVEVLLDRLGSGDAQRLGDALAWVLSQPLPLGLVVVRFSTALRELTRSDIDRAVVVARRALDVFGPRSACLREAMLEVAGDASDDAFAAVILERWLACGADGGHRRSVFVQLADLRERLGDEEGQSRIIARAVREGFSSAETDEHLRRLAGRPATPDAQLWRMTAQASRSIVEQKPEVEAAAWRELGAALWDLADDRVGAIAAWRRSARISGAGGYTILALDIIAFGGAPFAFEYIERVVETEPDDVRAAEMAAEAATAALWSGESRTALQLCARSVARYPRQGSALEVAEPSARRCGEYVGLSELYDAIADRSFGRFGRRAVHYRGARFFGKLGEHSLALKHAAKAFLALPSEGSTLHLLAHAAARAGDSPFAVQAVEQVAETAEPPQARAAWLLRAGDVAGDAEEGIHVKVDMVLRAIHAAPNAAMVAVLRDALIALLALDPDGRDPLHMRVSRAAQTLGGDAGPEAARVAIAFAVLALELFDDADGALASTEKALGCDGSVDAFEELSVWAARLARARDAAQRVTAILVEAERPASKFGGAAMRLLLTLADRLGEDGLRARAAVAAALRDPDDDALVLAADEAVRGAPQWADRLDSHVSIQRRAQAILAVARGRVAKNAYDEAVPLFERALPMVDERDRAAVERELRASRLAVGREPPLEPREGGVAREGATSPRTRGDRWMEVAERREARGDVAGALNAAWEACRLDPEPLERWTSLERLAERAGDDAARIHALQKAARRIPPDGQAAVLKRLARALDAQGDTTVAAPVWQEVLAIDPTDDDADEALEGAMAAHGQYTQLVDHLARRAVRLSADPSRRETLRAVRLRRAAILEQRLDRARDALDELSRLVEEIPDSPGALRYLADLLDRSTDPAGAARCWLAAARLELDPTDREDLELRAGRAFLASNQVSQALDLADRMIASRPNGGAALGLRVDAARASKDDVALGDALAALARADGLDASARSDLLVEAAMIAARTADLRGALERAREAALASPQRGTPQLLARGLEYRFRGAGAPNEARRTIADLGAIEEPLTRDDTALRSFLLAEALDVIEGGSAGLRELQAAHASVGAHPLVAVGIGERLAAQGNRVGALEQYQIALSGPLLDLRKPGQVALVAADAASRADRPDDALMFLEVAERHDESRWAARERRALLQRSKSAPSSPAGPLERPDPPIDGDRSGATAPPTPPAELRHALGRSLSARGDLLGAEAGLWEQLRGGVMQAGDRLAEWLAASPDRTRDLVRVRYEQVAIEPGDIGRLALLQSAALADGDRLYARALEHVARAFDVQRGPLPPPPLTALPEQVGVFGLLTRSSVGACGEALALLWEEAKQLFVRDPLSYDLGGSERVVPGPTSTIARIYQAAIRVLDGPRIPLFFRPAGGQPSGKLAVLSQPAILLTADAHDESAALLFALGRSMSDALPQNVLCLGLPESEARAAIAALRAAFGSTVLDRSVTPEAARLAEAFWQIVPARAQRRLQQLLSGGQLPEYEELVVRAMHVGRRVGMFLAGDFGFAARELLAETPSRLAELGSPLDLRRLCEREPLMADLFRLAVSPEYAQARWHMATSETWDTAQASELDSH
jgi:cellulose synthase operon protein C